MKTFFRRDVMTGVLALGLLAGVGCTKSKPAPSSSSTAKSDSTTKSGEDHGHSHERGKMLIADAGKYHALLTAHLAKEGNELDIFFETGDKNPKPAAIPLASFTAQATVGDGEAKELKFEPAPADERPKDEKPGTCSHFVAKAPWMKPTDNLYVRAIITLDGKEVTIRWTDFNPKKYAHHEE